MKNLQLIFQRFILLYVLIFILSFSFPFYIFPDLGGWIGHFFEPINLLWRELFGLKGSFTSAILSDTTGLYLHLITIFILSITGVTIWTLLFKQQNDSRIWQWFYTFIAYYLALILFIYGFDKVFKHQFYLPEPNTLYTPVGRLSPDILYWTSMGSSYTYSIFSGLLEILPAFLLLFKKTRLLGGLIAFAVLSNVVMINFGFDISVKVFSLFLFGLTLMILAPHLQRMIQFFSGQSDINQSNIGIKIESKKHLRFYAIIKPLVIGLILFEALAPYFVHNNFNDDLAERPHLHGAYTVESFESDNEKIPPSTTFKSRFNRYFIHRQGYFIVQFMDDKFESFELFYDHDYNRISIVDSDKNEFIFTYKETENSLSLNGSFRGELLYITSRKENLSELPLMKSEFHWTIDCY